jgi:hypothetical protein
MNRTSYNQSIVPRRLEPSDALFALFMSIDVFAGVYEGIKKHTLSEYFDFVRALLLLGLASLPRPALPRPAVDLCLLLSRLPGKVRKLREAEHAQPKWSIS